MPLAIITSNKHEPVSAHYYCLLMLALRMMALWLGAWCLVCLSAAGP
jgi:hypothetical protein